MNKNVKNVLIIVVVAGIAALSFTVYQRIAAKNATAATPATETAVVHRWLVLPFIALLLTVIFARGTSLGDSAQRIQSVLMIIMAITGLYLY